MKWIFAALFFGLLTAMFCVMFSMGWDNHSAPVTFTASHAGQGGFTTLDRPVFLSILAVLCGLGCLGSIAAVFVSREDAAQSKETGGAGDFGADGWVCAYCQESNPGNFDECWKCQHKRPNEPGPASRSL